MIEGHPTLLKQHVQGLIREGWRPLGGPIQFSAESLMQAMTRETRTPDAGLDQAFDALAKVRADWK